MNRLQFLRNLLLGIGAVAVCPKEIFANSDADKQLPVIPSLSNSEEDTTKELIKLAKHFASNCKQLSNGHYLSLNHNYRIDYLEKLCDEYTKEEVNTPLRVGKDSGIIQISRNKIKDMPECQIFNLIIWGGVHRQLNCDYMKSDIQAIKISLDAGYSKKEIATQYLHMFETAESELNRRRIENIFKLA